MSVDRLFKDRLYLEDEIRHFESQKQVRRTVENKDLALAHANKAMHNIKFYHASRMHKDFSDWLVVILYYALYHCALALIANKRYHSKNHYATMLILIKEYLVTREEAGLMDELYIGREDAELYFDLKEERQKASYSTRALFGPEKIRHYEKEVVRFINKTQEILLI